MIRFMTTLIAGMTIGYYVTHKDMVEQRTIGFNHGVQAAMHDETTKNACLKVLFDIQEENNTRKKK